MLKVIIDTSVWIEYFRNKKGNTVTEYLDMLLKEDRVVLCGVVEMELLRGVRTHERDRIKDLLSALHSAETLREDFSRRTALPVA